MEEWLRRSQPVAIGFAANRRLQDAQRGASTETMTGAAANTQVCTPIATNDGRVPALRSDHPLTQALLTALVVFRANPDGFSNRELRDTIAPRLGVTPASMTPGAMTYHQRWLRCHDLIVRTPRTNRSGSPPPAFASLSC